MKIMTRPFTFVVAVLYGAAWIVGPLNILAAIQSLGEGGSPGSYLSTIVLNQSQGGIHMESQANSAGLTLDLL